MPPAPAMTTPKPPPGSPRPPAPSELLVISLECQSDGAIMRVSKGGPDETGQGNRKTNSGAAGSLGAFPAGGGDPGGPQHVPRGQARAGQEGRPAGQHSAGSLRGFESSPRPAAGKPVSPGTPGPGGP